jgi:hypothetical protein
MFLRFLLWVGRDFLLLCGSFVRLSDLWHSKFLPELVHTGENALLIELLWPQTSSEKIKVRTILKELTLFGGLLLRLCKLEISW